jgi:F-type H+-transporting ATPase subunit delta
MNMIAVARPYAQAVFEHAQATQTLTEWATYLKTLKDVFQQDDIAQGLKNPATGGQVHITEVLKELLGAALSTEQGRFLDLLAEHDRLAAIPAISVQFEAHLRSLDRSLNIDVTTAEPWTPGVMTELKDSLSRRFGQTVNVQFNTSSDLIGGMVIHAQDTVIDGSLAYRLTQLAHELKGDRHA